jgi:general secretion pathway protein A
LIASTTIILLGFGGFAVFDNQTTQQPIAAPIELPADVQEMPAASDSPDIKDSEPELAATETIVVPVEPSLETVLLQNQALTGTNDAMQNLFAQWGLEYDPTLQSACKQAEEQGLNCLFQRGTWNVVRQLDRPAILNLTDTSGYEHQVVLTRIGEHGATLAIGELVGEFSQESISDLWYGEYLLLWRPPNGRSTALQAGMRDDSVLWLREGLAKFDPALATTSDDPRFFDAQLTESLKDFQRRNRLKVDGLAGQQTQIILNSGLGLENTPRLSN